MGDYLYKTTPYKHQETAFLLSRDMEAFALVADMGTGKSKIIIDTAAWLYMHALIDALVVLAPNGVHRNWIVQEIPAHMPDHIPHRAMYYTSDPKKAERDQMDWVLAPYAGQSPWLRIIAINIEALSHLKAKKFLYSLARSTKGMIVMDEGSRIKSPGAKRTKTALAAAPHFPYRRVLSGYPIPQGPFDFYTQFKFIDPDIIPFSTFTAFKSYFGEFERKIAKKRIGDKVKEWEYDVLQSYRNIDELLETIRPYCFRVRKQDCLDLPPKVYVRRSVVLSQEQRRLYNELMTKSLTQLRLETGELPPPEEASAEDQFFWYLEQSKTGRIKTKLPITRRLRLRQILGGFATDDEGTVHQIDATIPRVTQLLEMLEEHDGKAIIWAHYRAELAAIAATLRKAYGDDSVVEYHGGVDKDVRANNIVAFQDPESPARWFVGNEASGGIGLTLTAADLMIYYSHDDNSDTREQSEDRAHRIGQTKKLTIVDMIAPGTVEDTKVRQGTIHKKEVSDSIVNKLSII